MPNYVIAFSTRMHWLCASRGGQLVNPLSLALLEPIGGKDYHDERREAMLSGHKSIILR